MKLLMITLLVCYIGAGCKKDDPELPDCGITADDRNDVRHLRILFIGTSHTFYNELPKMVSSIAGSIGDSVYTEMSAPGGYDFERHFKLDATTTALHAGKWDCIVLQESGWRTALPPSLTKTSVYPFADSLHLLIKKTNPNARLILYMTNGYVGGVNAFGDTAWCNSDPLVCSFEGMLTRIKGTYLQLASQLNAAIAPCGLIWKEVKTRNSNMALHDPDNIHPSLAGSYANALTIYSVIRKKRLKGVYTPPAIPNEQSTLIQNTISDVLFDCNPGWKDL